MENWGFTFYPLFLIRPSGVGWGGVILIQFHGLPSYSHFLIKNRSSLKVGDEYNHIFGLHPGNFKMQPYPIGSMGSMVYLYIYLP